MEDIAESIYAPFNDVQPQSIACPSSPTPFLTLPILFLINLHPNVPDSMLANGPLRPFTPVKIFVDRHVLDRVNGSISGTIEFQTRQKAEKALAIVHSLRLLSQPRGHPQPKVTAKPLTIKNLSLAVDDSILYDLFRPFGPIKKVRCRAIVPTDCENTSSSIAMIQFFNNEDARQAQLSLNGTELQGSAISVESDTASQSSGGDTATTVTASKIHLSATAPVFVPRAKSNLSPLGTDSTSSLSATPSQLPTRPMEFFPHTPLEQVPPGLSPAPMAHVTPPCAEQLSPHSVDYALPLQMGQVPVFFPPEQPVMYSNAFPPGGAMAPPQLDPCNGPILPVPGTKLKFNVTASTYIDPCNLFCKSLDPSIDDSTLFNIFKEYGRIVSARVITDSAGNSRGHGFVSYSNADEAARALHALNGMLVGSRHLYVRLHEPRTARKDKLAKRFGVDRDNTSPDSGLTSLYTSSYEGSPNNCAPHLLAGTEDMGGRSQFGNEITASATPPLDEALLSSIAPEAREKYMGDCLYRRVRSVRVPLDGASADDIVSCLRVLPLGDQIKMLFHDDILIAKIEDIKRGRAAAASTHAVGLGLLGLSEYTEEVSPISTLSGEHGPANNGLNPPIKDLRDGRGIVGEVSGPPRNRIVAALKVMLPDGAPVESITDLIVKLDRQSKAMCLLDNQFLLDKAFEIMEALNLAEALDEGSRETKDISNGPEEGDNHLVDTKQADLNTSTNTLDGGSETLPVENNDEAVARMSNGREANADSATLAAAEAPTEITRVKHTLSSLAELSCKEIMSLIISSREAQSQSQSTSNSVLSDALPLPPISSAQWTSSESIIERYLAEPKIESRKQRLGDDLFKKAKPILVSAGLARGGMVNKVVLTLLDREDLLSLGMIMNLFEGGLFRKLILKEVERLRAAEGGLNGKK